MSNLRTTTSVLSTIQAAFADIVTLGHKLSITGCPTMDYRTIQAMLPQASLVEQLQVTIVTPIASNSTTYRLVISQFVPALGHFVTFPLVYTTNSIGDTATTICNAFRAELLSQTAIQITGSGTTTLILTAITGSPLFTVTNIEPVSTTVDITTGMAGVAIASNTTASPSVITSVAHGLSTGNVITIVSVDNTKLASGTYRVTSTGANTYTLASLDGTVPLAGTATTTATVQKVAQFSAGQGAALIASGITAASTGHTYTQWAFVHVDLDGTLMGNTESSQSKHTLYVDEGVANFAAFESRMVEVEHAFAPSTTVSDPELISFA